MYAHFIQKCEKDHVGMVEVVLFHITIAFMSWMNDDGGTAWCFVFVKTQSLNVFHEGRMLYCLGALHILIIV